MGTKQVNHRMVELKLEHRGARRAYMWGGGSVMGVMMTRQIQRCTERAHTCWYTATKAHSSLGLGPKPQSLFPMCLMGPRLLGEAGGRGWSCTRPPFLRAKC